MFQILHFPLRRGIAEHVHGQVRWTEPLIIWLLLSWVAPLHADENFIRLGWIDRFESVSLSDTQFNALQSHLVGYDPLSCPEQRVVLQRVCDNDISMDPRTIRGVCGTDVQIPEAFEVSSLTRFYRGVIFDKRRPSFGARQKWLWESRDWTEDAGSPVIAMPVLSPDLLPSDVVVCIDGDGNWQIGCDFNANLNFEPSERFEISAEQLDRPIIASAASTTVVMRGDTKRSTTSNSLVPELHVLCIATPVATSQQTHHGQAMIADLAAELSREDMPRVEWVLLPTGRGPADVAAAMTAAARAGCDALVVNLDGLLHRPTDAARLLAELSHRSKLPVVTTKQTPISPNFIIAPARRSIPDLAETQFPRRVSDTKAFADAVDTLISDLPRYRQATQAEVLTGPPAQPNHYVQPIAEEISSDHFVQIVGRGSHAARVPGDAIDGRVNVRSHQLKFDDVGGRLYDEQGMRITAARHDMGIQFARMPPAPVYRARGGYLLTDRSLSERARTRDTLRNDVSLRWTRQRDIADTMDIAHNKVSVAGSKVSDDPLPGDTSVKPRYQIDRLRRIETTQVPERLTQMAAGLTRRGPDVVSWWYREPSRHGSVEPHHLFQDEFKGPAQWPNDRLQFWVMYENGRLLPGYRSIGDACGSEPADAWILVQTVLSSDVDNAAPPELLQSSTLAVGKPHDLPWRRIPSSVFHLEHAAEDIETVSAQEQAIPQADNHFLLGELRPDNEEAPGYGWLWTGTSPPASEQGPWLSYYDDDATQAAIDAQKSRGQTAAQIVARTPRPDDDSKDLVAWREYLLAIDQGEIRKSHLDLVVDTARRVLAQCRQRMGGLPSPEPPYPAEPVVTKGSAKAVETDASADFEFHVNSDFLHTYAWAVDAAYRLTRAIGYRELPEVLAEHPIVDQGAQDQAYEAALYQLCGLVKITDPRFFLTLRRYHHSRDEPIQAYQVLTRYGYEGPATLWYFKKERDAFQQSGVTSLSRLGHARWFLHETGEPIRQTRP